MSLPPATKQTTENPSSSLAVAQPVNREEKNLDAQRKLRLYTVIQAFRAGKLPSNEQTESALRYVLDHPPVDRDKLSPDGQKLIADTRDIVETLRTIIKSKNHDELFQKFVWHTRYAAREGIRDKQGISVPEKELKEGETPAVGSTSGRPAPVTEKRIDDEQSEEEEAVRHLRTLLSLVLTNSELRKLLSDFSVIGRDLLSRGMHEAATLIAPSPDDLQKVDEPAPPSGSATERRGVAESHSAEVSPEAGPVGVKSEPVDTHVGPSSRRECGSGPTEEGERHQALLTDREAPSKQGRGEHFNKQGSSVTQAVTQSREETQRVLSEKEDKGDIREGPRGAVGTVKTVMGSLRDKLPEGHNEKLEKGKTMLKEEFPEERREQFIYRGKKAIIECQKQDDYKASVRWLLNYVRNSAARGREHGRVRLEGARDFAERRPLQTTIDELRTLLQRFANNRSMAPIDDAFYVLVDDAKRDSELKNWFKEVDAYISEVLLQEGYVLEPACNARAKELRREGRKFYDGKYKSEFDNLFNSVGDFFNGMGEDPLNKRFGEDWSRLTKDLLFDREGSLKFKKHLWNDIRTVIIPQLTDKVGYIPIPRIEYTDPRLDLVVENLTLSGKNLLPNIVSVEAHNFIKFSPYKEIADEGHHRFTLTFSQIQADLRDVMFYFKQKQGVVRMKDSGVADVVMGGKGMTITTMLVSAGKDLSSVFHVHDVHVKISSLKFSVRDTKHDWFYKTIKPFMTALVKKQIKKAMADAIRTGLEYGDGQLVRVKDRMAELPEADEKRRSEILQEMFSPGHPRPKSVRSSTSGTAPSAASTEKHFKVVGSKRDSMLASVRNPAGWASQVAEKEEAARKGTEWRSDAFSIVKDEPPRAHRVSV